MSTYPQLLAAERVTYATKKHLVIFMVPVVLAMLLLLLQQLSWSADHSNNPLLAVAPFPKKWRLALPWLAVLYLWLKQLLSYLSSSYLVTDRRVMLREGFFFLRSSEINLLNIGEINIEQSLLGRLFNYGSIKINSFGGGAEVFILIAAPNKFKQQIMENQLLLTAKLSKS